MVRENNHANASVPTINSGQSIKYSNEMFKVKSLASLIEDPRNSVPSKQVLGYWGYEGETIVIGGTTNCGKSILASDILFAVGCCKVSNWSKFDCEIEEKCLLIDSEMSEKQYVRRYKSLAGSKNILRASFWNSCYHGDDMEALIDSIRSIVASPDGPRFIVVDNISTISALISPTQVLKMLAMLESLKQDYRCTLVIVTHTNKTSKTKCLELNDFRGTKVLSNAADTIIGIGNTNEDSETKYIKLMKSRNSRIPETVSLVRISDKDYLHFEYIGEVQENDILPKGKKRGPSSSITDYQAEKIKEMQEEGLSVRQIANSMGISKSTVHRFLNSPSD